MNNPQGGNDIIGHRPYTPGDPPIAIGAVAQVRLSRRKAARRREANEQRPAALLVDFGRLEPQPVVFGTSWPDRVDGGFTVRAEQRRSSAWAR